MTYKAFDVDLHCPVTLKVISERYLAEESARLRFLREARAAARLRHPNVARSFTKGFPLFIVPSRACVELLQSQAGASSARMAKPAATCVAISSANFISNRSDRLMRFSPRTKISWPSPHTRSPETFGAGKRPSNQHLFLVRLKLLAENGRCPFAG